MIKMTKAMGVTNPTSGKDFIKALDDLIASVGCSDLRMSDAGITKDELKKYPKRVHEVLGATSWRIRFRSPMRIIFRSTRSRTIDS
ncbi:MAG: hypothetical protein LKG56_00050 [Lachnospiraceae bacterium]|jgi:hypothetical protein|nr:hypothetical protein [Lachnospiraceae bacterium]MCH4030082.1 hypothetical protein [Lachnospiraceae bacterium]MCH4070264.1 hypothetical protein [Lachnospiraceae bacterium]MCH4107770.1 hypothetical protein [Lachnospiraceae bacterium]MCI1301379.1 hypothetical protein [Lachnospiraceae bacterium]